MVGCSSFPCLEEYPSHFCTEFDRRLSFMVIVWHHLKVGSWLCLRLISKSELLGLGGNTWYVHFFADSQIPMCSCCCSSNLLIGINLCSAFPLYFREIEPPGYFVPSVHINLILSLPSVPNLQYRACMNQYIYWLLF